jgi:hypothetical protein
MIAIRLISVRDIDAVVAGVYDSIAITVCRSAGLLVSGIEAEQLVAPAQSEQDQNAPHVSS